MAGDILHFAEAFFLEFRVSPKKPDLLSPIFHLLRVGARCPIKKNILTCAFPSALRPSGQPLVAHPTGFPAFRFTAWPVKCEAYFTGPRQLRMKPRSNLEQRRNPPLHLDRPRPHLAQAIEFGNPLHPNHNIPITHIFSLLSGLLLWDAVPLVLGLAIWNFCKDWLYQAWTNSASSGWPGFN